MSEKCESCGCINGVEQHHIKYVPEKTVPLCRSCHKYAHSNEKSQYHPEQKLNDIQGVERDSAPPKASLTVKNINDNMYVYWQWRESGEIKSEYIDSMDVLKENVTSWGEI